MVKKRVRQKRICHHPEKSIKRIQEYLPGDVYGYTILCKCGWKISDWWPAKTEEKLIQERQKLKEKKKR